MHNTALSKDMESQASFGELKGNTSILWMSTRINVCGTDTSMWPFSVGSHNRF